MAGTTIPSTSAPTTSSAALTQAAPSRPSYVAPAVAAAIGALSGLVATWAIVATQTLQMSL